MRSRSGEATEWEASFCDEAAGIFALGQQHGDDAVHRRTHTLRPPTSPIAMPLAQSGRCASPHSGPLRWHPTKRKTPSICPGFPFHSLFEASQSAGGEIKGKRLPSRRLCETMRGAVVGLRSQTPGVCEVFDLTLQTSPFKLRKITPCGVTTNGRCRNEEQST
jgi:hypothetical protein